MSLRTIQRLAMASVLALGGITAVGCDDDDGDGDGSDGQPDGGDGGGDGDGGDGGGDGQDGNADGDAGTDPLAMCLPCEDTNAGLATLEACCDRTSGTPECGGLVPEALGGPLVGCFAKDQPGNAKNDHCTDFIDGLDGVTDGQGFRVKLSVGFATLQGCCTDVGLCGVALNEFEIVSGEEDAGPGIPVTPGFGCIPVTRFLDALGGGDDAGVPDGGMPPTTNGLAPFCVPGSETLGACPPRMKITETANLCDSLNASPLPVIGCDPATLTDADLTPKWVCAAQEMALIETGAPPAPDAVAEEGGCLKYLPKWLPGCVGAPAGTTACVPNVSVAFFGCEDQPVSDKGTPDNAADDCLIGLPEYARGCGDTPTQGCLLNTPALFGCESVTMGPVPNLPEYACGCGDGVVAAGCIPNIPTDLCGAVPHATGDVPGVPEYACGCGDGVRGSGQCIPNVPNMICGAIEVTAGPIPNLPNAACGCGDEMLGANCIPNVPNTVCGQVASCTPVGMQGGCPDNQLCVSNTPTAAPDAIGDACQAAPPPPP